MQYEYDISMAKSNIARYENTIIRWEQVLGGIGESSITRKMVPIMGRASSYLEIILYVR